MKKFPNIIFDFDGVIGDTFPHTRDIACLLYEEFRHEKPRKEMIGKLIGKGVRAVIKELNVPLTKIPYFEKRFRQELALRIDKVKIFKGVKAVLKQIKKAGYPLGILSSNSQKNLHYIFQKNQIDFFDFIYSDSSFFGKGKVLAKLLKKLHLKPAQTIYIGDEERDIQASQQNKVKVIAVGWGYDNEKVLKKEKPDFFAKEPKDLLKILKRLC
ncbi:HAD-IA family hydrolase [Patescibacteria group bacterium]|nr:HAD-IA family hydrolase [Patescibacteria group bacterium]